MIGVKEDPDGRVSQGDIYRDIPMPEYAALGEGDLELSRILVFPYVIILTQDCDLAHDPRCEDPDEIGSNYSDSRLLSVLVAPIYNEASVYTGEQLKDFGFMMAPIKKSRTPGENIRKNLDPRRHYLEFPSNVPIVPSIIDFKHYFSVNLGYLIAVRSTHYVCQVSELYREQVSQRFASFLSRIGLPEVQATAACSQPETGPEKTQDTTDHNKHVQ